MFKMLNYLVIFNTFVLGNCILLNELPPPTQNSVLTDQHYNFLLDLLAEEKQLRHQLEQIVSNQQTDLQNMSKIISQMQMSTKGSCDLVDVSRGKIATESHTHGSYNAKNAIDGRLDTISHTDNNGEIKPWLLIDLGQVYAVERVEIYNRVDNCGDRLKNLLVSVGNTTSSLSWCGYFQGPGINGQVIVLQCPMTTNGRYVKLTINNDDPNSILHLAEVRVYAKP